MKNTITILVVLAVGINAVNFIWLVSLQNQTVLLPALPEKLRMQEICIVDKNGKTAIKICSTGIFLFGQNDLDTITLFNATKSRNAVDGILPSHLIFIADADHTTLIGPGGAAFTYNLDNNYVPDGIILRADKNITSLRMRHGNKESEIHFELDDYGPMLGVFDRNGQPAFNLFDK